MKPEIENLKVWMSGKSTTGYQRALAMREFEQLLTYVAELEQLRQPPVSGRSELLFAFIAEIKSEFADQNLDYLDFIADRVIGKQ